MEDISRAIILAFIAIIGALMTQVGLRWDQARRDTRLRLLEGIRIEHALFERVAYKARQVLLGGHNDVKPKNSGEIDELLFCETYQESHLVTLCAELDSYGVSSKEYLASAHRFRQECLKIAKCALEEYYDPEVSIENVRCEIKKISAQTKRMTQNIHYRFAWF